MTDGEIVDIINFRAFFAFFVHSSSFFSYSSVAAVVHSDVWADVVGVEGRSGFFSVPLTTSQRP